MRFKSSCFLFLVYAAAALTDISVQAQNKPASMPKLEIGIDRSNMATEWTLSPPGLPNIYPFNGPYNGPGVFEARRVAVFDGMAKLHPQWFRDGFGADTPADAAMFVDTVTQVHARGMKMLAVIGHTGSDFDPKYYINPTQSGCQWGTFPLSKIDLTKLEHRLRTHFDALKKANLSVDAFEVDNELDLYCNDADMPKGAEFAAHHWQWFLSPEQVHAFAAGYAPYLKKYVEVVREYFPHAKIITCGMSNPTGNSAPLIQALANFKDSSGKVFDYTSLVDGYGTHIYVSANTTLAMVTSATQWLTSQAALLPHIQQKPIWITEWNEAGSAFWSSHKWYFQFRANQEAVCRAATDGRDLLLVMPTGAGKSLCYQLPAIARGGTALVISPLIALMDDQAPSSPRRLLASPASTPASTATVSRQACRDYLDGTLSSSSSPRTHARPRLPRDARQAQAGAHRHRRSPLHLRQWGHDFRPDYRMLGPIPPALRPAPVIALTATATPPSSATSSPSSTSRKRTSSSTASAATTSPSRSSKSKPRAASSPRTPQRPSRRPAIVYAPPASRRRARLAARQEVCPTAAYHAGLPRDPRARPAKLPIRQARVRRRHHRLRHGHRQSRRPHRHPRRPARHVEGYYQEIGRAGRDGQPSRTILMHSFADIRMHDFFLKRDYPPAIEKLFIHGGAAVDYNNNATRGDNRWTAPYTRQSDYRRNQLELVQKFVDGHQCRMAALVQHFGDTKDGQTRCGLCDFCSPSESSAQQYREPSRQSAPPFRPSSTPCATPRASRSAAAQRTPRQSHAQGAGHLSFRLGQSRPDRRRRCRMDQRRRNDPLPQSCAYR
jgi:hypothetical protein